MITIRSAFLGLLVGAFVLGLDAKPGDGLIEIDENHLSVPEPEPAQPVQPNTVGHDNSGNNGGFQEVTESSYPGLGFGGSDFKPEFPGMDAPTGGQQLLEPKEPLQPVEPQYPEEPVDPVEPDTPVPVEPQQPVEPKEPTKAPESTEQKKPGHGGLGGLGSLWNPWKNIIKENKDSVNKAVESVKEAGEKIVEAGKDVIGAGIKIGQSLPGIGKHLQGLNKLEEQKKKPSFFPNILGRSLGLN